MSSFGNQLGKRANQPQKLILNKETFLTRERLSGMKEVCRALQETESHPTRVGAKMRHPITHPSLEQGKKPKGGGFWWDVLYGCLT